MKCPNCKAEVTGTHCNYCGSTLPSEKAGCPKCKSKNIQYQREKQGEIKGNNTKHSIIRTVGMCKDCGNTWYTDANTIGNTAPNTNQPQPPQKKTWLWVLGWICVFPIPLTILLLRRKEMNPKIKYGVIAAAWILYICIAASGKSEESAPVVEESSSSIVAEESTVVVEEETQEDNNTVETTIPETETVEEIKYADDKVVNQFIIDFNETAGYELTNVSRGNIQTKYFAYAKNCYLEILNATESYAETFKITYFFNALPEEEILSCLKDCLKALGATDDEIEQTIKAITEDKSNGYDVNSSINLTYYPSVELSYGMSNGHVKICSSTYGK